MLNQPLEFSALLTFTGDPEQSGGAFRQNLDRRFNEQVQSFDHPKIGDSTDDLGFTWFFSLYRKNGVKPLQIDAVFQHDNLGGIGAFGREQSCPSSITVGDGAGSQTIQQATEQAVARRQPMAEIITGAHAGWNARTPTKRYAKVGAVREVNLEYVDAFALQISHEAKRSAYGRLRTKGADSQPKYRTIRRFQRLRGRLSPRSRHR